MATPTPLTPPSERPPSVPLATRTPHPHADAEQQAFPAPAAQPPTPPTTLAATPHFGRVTPSRRTRTDIARNPTSDSGLTCLATYLTIVMGTPRVRPSSVQAAAALVAASTSIETANPELRVSVQVWGVSPAGVIS